MKWLANIFVDDIRHGDMYSYFPFPADNSYEAAYDVAKAMAKRLYGEQGEVSFVNQTKDGLFKACIGVYQGAGVTKGRSLSILLREYRGVQ